MRRLLASVALIVAAGPAAAQMSAHCVSRLDAPPPLYTGGVAAAIIEGLIRAGSPRPPGAETVTAFPGDGVTLVFWTAGAWFCGSLEVRPADWSMILRRVLGTAI